MTVTENKVRVCNVESVYSDQELALVDLTKIPEHVAIIMDGNRRWAKRNNLAPIFGHCRGCETLTEIVKAACELGIKILTVFAFSTENWKRSEEEVQDLMNIFEMYLENKRSSMCEEGIKVELIGDISRCTAGVRKAFGKTRLATSDCDKIKLVMAINYGSRDEITRAVGRILEDYDKKKIVRNEISEELISSYLDTAGWKDPDLLIRTSGELRLSNFLLWQISYTEVFATSVLWPDFSKSDLLNAVLSYQRRNRRYGGDEKS